MYVAGTNSLGYPQYRNYAGLPFTRFRFKKVRDLSGLFGYLYYKLTGKTHPYYLNTFNDLDLNKADIYHFFNTVSMGSKPWVVTFEHELPRHNTGSRKLVQKLASPACKKIIAISRNAVQAQQYYLDQWPEYKDVINSKIIVLPPAQEAMIASMAEKKLESELSFAFVGRAFFHKGGMEMLHSFSRLLNSYPKAHLTIVSDLTKINWLDAHITGKDRDEALKLIAQHSANITHHLKLPSHEVARLFMRTHVGLLPSYGETYGYSVLEAQACGCPVVTPDTWAFSEFNSNAVGWLLDVPKVMDRNCLRADIGTEEKRVIFSEALKDGLYKAMMDAGSNLEMVAEKGSRALAQVKERHSPGANAAVLEKIYLEAICS